MSPKSKTQKRREQRSKNSHPAGDRSSAKANKAASNNQQKALSQLKKQFEEQSILIRQQAKAIEVLKPKTGDPSMDSKSLKLDEKYVKVPDATQLALTQLGEQLQVVEAYTDRDYKTPSGKMTNVMQRESAVAKVKELVGVIKDLNKAPLTIQPSGNPQHLKAMAALKVISARAGIHHSLGNNGVFLRVDGETGADGHIKMAKLRIVLSDAQKTLTSSANTAYNSPYSLTPGASSEFSQLQSLFDEYICDEVTLKVRIYTNQTSAVDPAFVDGIIVYDPVDNSSYTAITGAIIANQKLGPFSIVGQSDFSNTVGSRSFAPLTMQEHGFWNAKFKMPIGPQVSAPVSVEILTGNWSSTADTGAIYGYLKPYIEAGGANVTTTQRWYVLYHCRFRSRT